MTHLSQAYPGILGLALTGSSTVGFGGCFSVDSDSVCHFHSKYQLLEVAQAALH